MAKVKRVNITVTSGKLLCLIFKIFLKNVEKNILKNIGRHIFFLKGIGER
jgi:hypothetical protein